MIKIFRSINKMAKWRSSCRKSKRKSSDKLYKRYERITGPKKINEELMITAVYPGPCKPPNTIRYKGHVYHNTGIGIGRNRDKVFVYFSR